MEATISRSTLLDTLTYLNLEFSGPKITVKYQRANYDVIRI